MKFTVFASGSKGNLYTVASGGTTLMLECGLSFQSIREKLKFSLSSIAGCLITHEHMDHAKAVKEIMKAGIDVYCSKGTVEARELSGHRLHIVKHKEAIEIGELTVGAYNAVHDASEPMMFTIRGGESKMLFMTDSMYCPYKFSGLTHLCIEANFSTDILNERAESGHINGSVATRIRKAHFSIENLIEMLLVNDLSQLKEIYLLHLSDNNSQAESFRKQVQQATGIPTYIA